MQLKDYFKLIDQIKILEKETFGRNNVLSENLVITIIQEYCKDLRTNQISEQKKAVSQIDLATDKQKQALRKLKIEFPSTITKQEAYSILKDKYSSK